MSLMCHPLHLKSPQRGSCILGNRDQSIQGYSGVISTNRELWVKVFQRASQRVSRGVAEKFTWLQSIQNPGNSEQRRFPKLLSWAPRRAWTLHPPGPMTEAPGCSSMPACWWGSTITLPVSQDKCERGYLWCGWQAYRSGCAVPVAAPHFSVSPRILDNLHCFIFLAMQPSFPTDWVGNGANVCVCSRGEKRPCLPVPRGAGGTQERVMGLFTSLCTNQKTGGGPGASLWWRLSGMGKFPSLPLLSCYGWTSNKIDIRPD